MIEYVVYRHDAGGESPGSEKRAVARVVAENPEDACRIAGRGVTVGGGERLSAEPADEADAREESMDRTARALGRPTGILDTGAEL